jgi:hypothetical protein
VQVTVSSYRTLAALSTTFADAASAEERRLRLAIRGFFDNIKPRLDAQVCPTPDILPTIPLTRRTAFW